MIILRQDNKFLLGKRSSWKERAPGYWCPVSGLIEKDESAEEAVIREAQEELGVLVKPVRKVTQSLTHDKSVMLHWWLSEIVRGEPVLNNPENEELRWFTSYELELLTPVFKEDIKILLSL